ncbi:hypothetical protein [Lacimicrobium sp. SS2-24]|uniref:hypothetical protein n=1 Tax=Lacimicrobium sp. SS2-24 TaxID=2005569 RepID=UPI000B4B0351|nr:hypothetical protein [Lacimicrobium sp. SS2-24]
MRVIPSGLEADKNTPALQEPYIKLSIREDRLRSLLRHKQLFIEDVHCGDHHSARLLKKLLLGCIRRS